MRCFVLLKLLWVLFSQKRLLKKGIARMRVWVIKIAMVSYLAKKDG